MKKVSEFELTKIVDDILYDAVSSMNLAEKVIQAIKDMEGSPLISYDYEFICPVCNENTFIEEVMDDVTMTSVITNLDVDEDDTLYIDYGDICTDDGDITSIRYQCSLCSHPVSEDYLKKLVKLRREKSVGK